MQVDVWSGLLLVNLASILGLVALTFFSLGRPAAQRSMILPLLALEVDLIVWILGRLLSYLSPNLSESYFWLRFSFGGVCLFGASMLGIALASNGYKIFFTRRWLALSAAPGAAVYLTALTNDWHRLFFTSVSWASGFPGLTYSPGPFFWLAMALIVLYLALAVLLFVLTSRDSAGWFDRGTILAAVVILLCAVANVLIFSLVVRTSLVLASLTISASVIVCALYQFRYWLLDAMRIALAQAAKQVGDGIVVLDLENRVLDANSGFCAVVQTSRQEILGQRLGDVVGALGNRVADLNAIVELMSSRQLADGERVTRDVQVKDSSDLTYELSVWPILNPGKHLIAKVAMLRDVTEARAATQSLREAIGDLEALHQTAVAMTSLRDLSVILGVILTDIRRLADAEGAHIAILDRASSSFTILAYLGEGGQFQLRPINRPPGPLSRQILGGRQARFVEDVDGEGALRSSSMDESTRAYAGLSLAIRDRLVGVLYLTYRQPHSFSPASRRLIQTFASHVAVAILNAQMFDEISRAATIDSLTELLNHRHLMQRLDEEISRARRSGHPLTVMMIDIDDFKLVNDAHGHTVGDQLLRLVAGILKETLRETDTIGRYGGDEFLALLPETDGPQAIMVAERVVSAIRAREFVLPRATGQAEPGDRGLDTPNVTSHPGAAIPIRLSVGLAVYPVDSASRLELVSLADAAMYCSKRSGSNTVTLAHATDSGFLAAQNTTFSVLEGLVNAVDGKDRYTRLHSEQVAHYALSLAEEIGLSEDAKRMLRIAGLLHDVGKIGIPDRILRKPGPLDKEERTVVEQHPLLSEMIMREIPQMTEVLEAVRHHHERYDGTGYPRGLQDGAIPFLSRVIAVADAYSAMILDRPYRRALSREEAIDQLRAGSGTQFDPNLVDAFVRFLGTGPEPAATEPLVSVSQ